ncbi:MFS transporter [bacterium]|nr:MAG: MFS transporter [bacterium]
MVRALRHRNYRLFFLGQLVSVIGTWMTATATSWLVYRLTGSSWLLGVVAFASQFPAFLLAPAAGVYVDRWDQRRLLIVTQWLSLAQSLTLAVLTFTGRVTMGWVVVLCAFQGLINAFDMPCRQAFVVSLVEDRQDLTNAIALNSTTFNGARLIGPALAGLLVSAWGEGWCFLLDGVSYLGVIAALGAMVIAAPPRRADAAGGALTQLREGWHTVFGFLPTRSIILLLSLVSLVGAPFGVLLPAIAAGRLGGGAHTLGFLMASAGVGALVGALWLASRRNVLGLGGTIPAATTGFGLALVGLAYADTQAAAMALLAVIGAGLVLQYASSNTILQSIVDDDKRGRVMSFFSMSFLGASPLGGLLAGAAADRFGVQVTLVGMGLSCLVGAVWFARRLPDIRMAIRPIYRLKGILPPLPAVEAG